MPASLKDMMDTARSWFPMAMALCSFMMWVLHADISSAVSPINAKLSSISTNVDFIKSQETSDQRSIETVRNRIDKIEESLAQQAIQNAFRDGTTLNKEDHNHG